jgi:hypothetical protein
MESLKAAWRGHLLRFHFRDARLRAMARDALEGPKPADPRDWLRNPTIVELGGRYASWLLSPPYWTSQVDRALLAALLLGFMSLMFGMGLVPAGTMLGGSVAVWISATLSALTIVSVAHALKSHGPAEPISPQSYLDAWARLRVATDDQVSAHSLPKSLLLVFVLLVDGAVLGIAMARSLGAFLTPRLAIYVAVAWGLASATLLWHLAVLAAREQRENAARATIRRLDGSGNLDERENARKFMATVGSRIGHDLSTSAPMKKRIALFAVSLMLAGASVGLRVAGGHAPTAAPMPVMAVQTNWTAASPGHLTGIPAPQATPALLDDIAPGTLVDRDTTITIWLGALVLAAVVVISATVLYWTLAKCECIDNISSPRDRAVVDRFDSPAAVAAFNHAHLQSVTSALESRLQRFAREVELAKRRLSPSEARSWPPVEVRANEVLAEALRPNQSANPALPVAQF